jgi:hypothetical protein
MTVLAESEVLSGSNLLDGEDGPEEPVTEVTRTQVTISTVGAGATSVSESDGVGSTIGWWHGATVTTPPPAATVDLSDVNQVDGALQRAALGRWGSTLAATNSGGVTSVGCIPRRVVTRHARPAPATTPGMGFNAVVPFDRPPYGWRKELFAIVSATEFDTQDHLLRGRYPIHGRTSKNIKQTAFWGLRRHFVIHGRTSTNRTLIFATFCRTHALNADEEGFHVIWQRASATYMLTITARVNVVDAGGDGAASFAWTITHGGWRRIGMTLALIAAAGADVAGAGPVDPVLRGLTTYCRRAAPVATASTGVPATAPQGSPGRRRRRADGTGD